MKKVSKILTGLLCVTLLMTGLCGCGKKEAPEAKVDMSKLKEAMMAADDSLPEMKSIDSSQEGAKELFSSLSDTDYDKVQDYFFCYAAEGTASEFAVIFVKDAEDVPEMEKSLRDHIESRILTYQNYSPEQVETAEKALVFSNGNYVAYVMHESPSYIKASFEKMMDAD